MRPQHRIGILTFHRCINQGSYWQARCLIEGLRRRGHDVQILDHNTPAVNVAEWRCALQPTLPTPVPRVDRSGYRLKIDAFHAAISQLPLSAPFDLRAPDRLATHDVTLVGSDEVWNPLHPWYGRWPLFFGEGLPTRRLVSYAVSFGNYDAAAGLRDDWSDRLDRFDAVSVRDENSADIVEAAVGRRPPVVLDPCLQFPPPSPAGGWNGPPGRFVAVYGHNFSPWFVRQIRRWADERRCPLVSISYRNDWADQQWIEAGPHDFAQAMSRADAVVTNFFHGCVFALHTAKPFVCETTPYRRNKLRCLMTAVGGNRHLMSEDATADGYDMCLDEPVDPQIARTIETLRLRSDAFLDAALG